MSRTIRTWLITVWCAGLVVSTTWILLFIEISDSAILSFSFMAIVAVMVGGYLMVMVPHNLVGTILVAGGSSWLIYTLGNTYAVYSMAAEGPPLPGEYVAAWLGAWTGAFLPISLVALLIFFPDGQLARGSKWLAVLLVALVVSVLIGAGMLWGVPADVLADFDRLDEVPAYGFVNVGFLIGFLLIVPAALLLLRRYRRSPAIERQQTKWLLYASGLFGMQFVVFFVLDAFGMYWDGHAQGIIGAIAATFIPVSVAFAVARYRLYDLDRLVSRTVAYAAVVGLLGLTFFGLITILAPLLPSQNDLAVAGSTLAVAALFNPLRKRALVLVDRRFNRSHYDAQRVVDTFASTLRDRVDPQGVVNGWVEVVSETMQPSSVGVWVKE